MAEGRKEEEELKKNGRAGNKRKGAPKEEEDDDSTESTTKKGRKAAPKQEAKSKGADTAELGTSSKPLSQKLKKSKSVVQMDAVDPNFGADPTASQLVIDKIDLPFSVLLVQNDRSKNMDKFYKLQLVRTDTVVNTEWKTVYTVYMRYGKTGTSGQINMGYSGSDLEAAKASFKQKFKEKTGWDWENGLENFKQKKNKYNLVLRGTASQTNDAKPPPGQMVMWQYYLENDKDGKPDGWYDYYPDANKSVEECYQQFLSNTWLDVRYVQSGYFSYKVDYNAMTQTNVTHHAHTSRPIRRSFKPNPMNAAPMLQASSAGYIGNLGSMASNAFGAASNAFGAVSSAVNSGLGLFNSPPTTLKFTPAFAPPSFSDMISKPAAPKTPPKASLKVVEKLDIINDESLAGVVVPKVKAYKASQANQPNYPLDYEILANCVLQITDIKNNNNKYYSLELHEGDQNQGKIKRYRLYTHYGRTDDLATKGHDSGQKEIRHYDTLQIAKAAYLKIYKEKTSKKKGYKPVNLVSSKIGSEKARNQAAGKLGSETEAKLKDEGNSPMKTTPKKTIKKKSLNLSPQVRDLIEYIYSEAKETLTSSVDVEITANGIETPLGILSLEQVSQGEDILSEIAKEVKKKKKNKKKLLDLSGEFYTAIPHRIGRSRTEIADAVISNLAEVAEKQDLCQLMRDMLQVNAEGTNVLYDKDATDEQYAALKCNIEALARSSKEFKDLVKHIEASQRRSHGDVFIKDNTIRNIFKVRRPEEEARFTTKIKDNQQLLFHGSRLCNFVGLLSRGILLPKIVVSMGGTRTDGGWLGDGIYFGDADTSCNYAMEGQKGTKLMLMNLVALGKMCDYDTITYGLTSPPPGYDSCHGVKGTEFDDDEYVVYTEEQQKIQYLVETDA
mmetsp:Transcript_30972/g.40892  ORF Transcript_30972/g.40892 Transcript_30972/m.40892 type:complete len:895 (-) Transcript_30972:265-2949(-)